MIAVVLNVLSIIVVVLLVILAVTLGVVALVLFVPVRYKCEGDIHGKKFIGCARVSWLFGFVALVLNKDSELTVTVLGIRIWRLTEDLSSEKSDKEPQAPDSPEEPPPKLGLRARFSKFIDDLRQAKRAIAEFRSFPNKGEIFSQTKLLVRRTLKAVVPRRLELTGIFGFDDPSRTGHLTGVISAIVPFAYPHVRLKLAPDFSRQVVELRLFVEGKITGISFVIPVCRFLFSPPVWRLVKTLLSSRKKARIATLGNF